MEFHAARWETPGIGQEAQGVPCRVALAEDGLVVLPEGREEVYLYYSDIDRLEEGDYRVGLRTWDGREFALRHLGSYYGQFVRDLQDRRKAQLVRNLLMADEGFRKDFSCAYRLEDAGRVASEDDAARVALYRNTLVVFPEQADPFNFAYCDLEGTAAFDEAAYTLTLRFDLGEKLTLTRMGTRFRELQDELTRAVDEMYERSARLLASTLPDTSEGTLFRLARALRMGKATSRARLEAVAPNLWAHLLEVIFVDETGQPSPVRRRAFEWLASRTRPELTYLGLREVDAAEGSADGGGGEEGDEGARHRPLYWFLVALPEHNALASEVTNESGHATYFFRIVDEGRPTPDQVERRVRELSRALQALNFRREVILASDEEMASERFLRYRVALRKLPYLREVRRLFAGRAIHRTEAGWEKRAEELLAVTAAP
ncbi:MAG: hypothetical protein AB1645_02015 [Bacillota bacterium]|jgi:hypothetical protein